VSPSRHDEFHQNAINVYLPERDGVRLTAARTLALDQTWRQLNVRRLMTMIRRVLYRQMQWAVFEPNNQKLRFQISRMLESYLRQLYRANAFTGATESQAFFVKCDDKLNPLAVQQQGRAIAQIGIAPAEPLEFIVLNVARDGDFSLTVKEG
jgi:phage tail sheath protein FI